MKKLVLLSIAVLLVSTLTWAQDAPDQQPVTPAVQQAAPQATPERPKFTPEQQAIADEFATNQQRIAALQELIRLQDRQKALAEAFRKLQAPPAAPKPEKKVEKKGGKP